MHWFRSLLGQSMLPTKAGSIFARSAFRKFGVHTVVRILCVRNRIFEKRRCYMSFRSNIRRVGRKWSLQGSNTTVGAPEKVRGMLWDVDLTALITNPARSLFLERDLLDTQVVGGHAPRGIKDGSTNSLSGYGLFPPISLGFFAKTRNPSSTIISLLHRSCTSTVLNCVRKCDCESAIIT